MQKKYALMENLINTFRLKLSLTPMAYVREFHDKINWSNRLTKVER